MIYRIEFTEPELRCDVFIEYIIQLTDAYLLPMLSDDNDYKWVYEAISRASIQCLREERLRSQQ